MFERTQYWLGRHRLRLYAALVLCCALPLLLFVSVAHVMLRTLTTNDVTKTAQQLVTIMQAQLADHFAAGIDAAMIAAQEYGANPRLSDAASAHQHLQRTCRSQPQVVFCSLHDRDGTPILFEPPDGREHVRFAVRPSDKPYVSDLHAAAPSTLVYVAVVAPIRAGGDTRPSGFIALWYDRATVVGWAQPPSLTATKYLLLVDQQSQVIAQGATLKQQGTTTLQPYEPVRLALAGHKGAGAFQRGDRRLLVVYDHVPIAGWALLLELPVEELRQALWRAEKPVALLGGGFLILAIGFGAIAGMLYFNMQGRERRQQQDIAATAAARYKQLFDANPAAMWTYDLQTLRFLDVNDAAVRHYGYTREEFLAMTIKDIRPPTELPRLFEKLATPQQPIDRAGTWKHRKKDGTLIDVEIIEHQLTLDGSVVALILAHDVTERKLLERQFLQAQKMEAVGRLAGGVAHDFNNLLGVIIGYADLLAETATDERTRERMGQIKKAAHRASDLTRQLLAFSRKQVMEPRVVRLNEVVQELAKMLQRLLGEDITLALHLAPDVRNIKTDPTQIEQVVMNLVVNARDAMPQGGQLRIETANVTLDASYAKAKGISLDAGDYVVLTVADSGTGMDDATKHRIFEPFFTTKEQGKGTGLGLATVYGIVKQSGGYIWVYSEAGTGTVFKIYVPTVADASAPRQPAAATVETPRGHETILLVEDSEALRELTMEMLESLGYRVLTAENGAAALRIANACQDAIHLLLTDIVMPGINGGQLADQLLAQRPSMKVLYMSGYTDDVVVHHAILQPGAALLQKPFSKNVLAGRVRAILGQTRNQHA